MDVDGWYKYQVGSVHNEAIYVPSSCGGKIPSLWDPDFQFHDELNSNTKYFCSLKKNIIFFKILVFYKLCITSVKSAKVLLRHK